MKVLDNVLDRKRKSENYGLVISPNGRRYRQSITIEASVIRGEVDETLGRPAWLTPEHIPQTLQGSFVLLRPDSTAPIALPGEVRVRKTLQRLSRAMSEHYNRKRHQEMGKDSLMTAATIAMVTGVLALCLVIMALYGTYQNGQVEAAEAREQNGAITRQR